jgi:ribosomal protein S18 acetylase RimI-like enzyme
MYLPRMSASYQIVKTELSDLDNIYDLFDASIHYQESKGVNVWRNYDRPSIENDIRTGNHYKVIADKSICLVFSVCYSDKIIWREMEVGDSIYLHRIVVNPRFKGARLFGRVHEWAIHEVAQRGLRFVRMDTWSDNQGIISYYKSFGFREVANIVTPDTPDLPIHNRLLPIALLQYEVQR